MSHRQIQQHDYWVTRIVDANKRGELESISVQLGKVETTTSADTNRCYALTGEVYLLVRLMEKRDVVPAPAVVLEMDGRAIAQAALPFIPGEVKRYGLV